MYDEMETPLEAAQGSSVVIYYDGGWKRATVIRKSLECSFGVCLGRDGYFVYGGDSQDEQARAANQPTAVEGWGCSRAEKGANVGGIIEERKNRDASSDRGIQRSVTCFRTRSTAWADWVGEAVGWRVPVAWVVEFASCALLIFVSRSLWGGVLKRSVELYLWWPRWAGQGSPLRPLTFSMY